MEEKVYLNKRGVKVTSSRIEIGGKTYATRHVASVGTAQVTPPYEGSRLAAFGSLGMFCWIIACLLSGPGIFSSGWMLLHIVSVLVMVAGAIVHARERARADERMYYVVELSTYAGDVDALKTKDKEHVVEVGEAIEKAITGG